MATATGKCHGPYTVAVGPLMCMLAEIAVGLHLMSVELLAPHVHCVSDCALIDHAFIIGLIMG